MVTTLLVPLCLLLTTLAGVCSLGLDTYVRSGEMVALECGLQFRAGIPSDAKLIWTNPEGRELSSDMSSAEQRQIGVLLYRRSFIILNATVNHQGNYSCAQSTPSRQFWFRLRVYTTQSREYEERNTYPKTCFTQESCTLHCPDVNIPGDDTPNITKSDIVWHKKGKLVPKGYFQKAKKEDHGVYVCTRSYLYLDQKYNMTFTVVLEVQPHDKSEKTAEIISPRHKDVFHVDVDSPAVIPCKAVVFTDFDSLVWLSGRSPLDTNENFPVFYNETRDSNSEEIKITASLVIKKVTKEDLSRNYSCNLDSLESPSRCVTITLALKARPSYVSLAVGVVCAVVVMAVISVVYLKFKISITLFIRDSLGCHRNTSDGKSYDAFLMCYKSETGVGLNEEDREQLKSTLEERFGYSLCLHDRDILPGRAVADAVLDCIEQSRTVVLVPTSPDPGLGSGLLSVIHSALVERETRLVFIKTESDNVSKSGSVHEALQLLGQAGDCVTWKGKHSVSLSSSFWKQLRYHLPAPQHTPKIKLLPQRV